MLHKLYYSTTLFQSCAYLIHVHNWFNVVDSKPGFFIEEQKGIHEGKWRSRCRLTSFSQSWSRHGQLKAGDRKGNPRTKLFSAVIQTRVQFLCFRFLIPSFQCLCWECLEQCPLICWQTKKSTLTRVSPAIFNPCNPTVSSHIRFRCTCHTTI